MLTTSLAKTRRRSIKSTRSTAVRALITARLTTDRHTLDLQPVLAVYTQAARMATATRSTSMGAAAVEVAALRHLVTLTEPFLSWPDGDATLLTRDEVLNFLHNDILLLLVLKCYIC